MAKDFDFEQIIEIWTEGIKETFPSLQLTDFERERFSTNFFNRQPFHFWVVEKEEKVVGWQSHIPCTNSPLKYKLYAETSIYVRQEFRGSKAAYQLYLHSLDYLKRATEIMFLFGYISLENVAALKIAKSFGFVQIGIIPNCVKNGIQIDDKHFVVNTLNSPTATQ